MTCVDGVDSTGMDPSSRLGVEERRWLGLLVLLVVVVAAIVIPQARTQALPGHASAAPPPAPPAVGACVTDPISSTASEVPMTPDAGSGAPPPMPSYPTQRLGGCTGSHTGEITALIKDPATALKRQGNGDATFDYDPNLDQCYQSAQTYTDGSAATSGDHAGAIWQPLPMRVGVSLTAPSWQQRHAGQRWLGCVIRTHDLGMPESTPTYQGTLRNALTTGNQRDRISTCLQDHIAGRQLAFDDPLTACSSPHAGELFSMADQPPAGTTRAVLQASCEQEIERTTGIANINGIGGLSILMQVIDSSGTLVTTASIPAKSGAACALQTTGGRMLKGSLLALHGEPIPWA